MSKLNVDQKTIKDLFQDKRADFLIPDYQRPYAWGETECQTLWDDIFSFAIPDEGRTNFDSNSEYFLGPIVTYKNEGRMEVIDGQQRLTTLMLLLRAFYSKFGHMQDKASISTKQNIEKCLWKTDEFGEPNMRDLKIDSDVATDNDKDEFLEILRTGEVKKGQKSRYAQNFQFFQNCIDSFLDKFPSYFAYLPTRIMNNCILLPIEAESQDTALRIFSTLNDRGKPLSDADIFKAQFYKFYSSIGKKDKFINRWKELEELCEKIFHPISGTPMDELFTRYMYFVRAKMGIKSSTTDALRKFYERDGYSLLKNEETFEDLVVLANFWNEVSNQDKDRFSVNILRKLFVLNYAPNSMWTYFVSVYFMQNRDEDGNLEEEAFAEFLDKITGFIWTYAVTNPGVNALRTPVYAEMVNIVNNQPVTFAEYRFDEDKVRSMFNNFSFHNARPITKAMLTWWAFTDDRQGLLSLENAYEIEHIYARNRQDKEKSLSNPGNLNALGNKALLEKRINIRASDYRFVDKKKYYNGFTNSRGQAKEGTKIQELVDLAASTDDFTESDIVARTERIMSRFVVFLKNNGLTTNK
ncbi:MAG: DUF262 domain-containing HNH endonuclease family protein [Clostridiales bacterium]|nr:DUF262 domain-containing HNH endonuclease family protein [Clostridiales bacterium]